MMNGVLDRYVRTNGSRFQVQEGLDGETGNFKIWLSDRQLSKISSIKGNDPFKIYVNIKGGIFLEVLIFSVKIPIGNLRNRSIIY